jgi:hypothetical protein
LVGQSLFSSIRIPCLLSFLGSQIFVFLIKDSLSLEVLGWPDFVYSLSFEVIGWLDNFIAVQVTWLPLNSLVVTDFVHFFQLQLNVYSIIPKHFYIACVCLSVSLQFFVS